uniref:phospholipase A n=1 Tax=Ningiella ruwaisensis TaxID=2364274 RepID=UPI00109F77EB|nr:phospholipase A [Ningiella ruwaisensis]
MTRPCWKRLTLTLAAAASSIQLAHALEQTEPENPPPSEDTPITEQVEKAVERNIDTNPRSDSLLDEKQEADSLANQNPFAITQHRLNYILPVSYNTSENTITSDGLNDANIDRYEAKFQVSVQLPLYLQEDEDNTGVFFGFTTTSFWQVYNSEASKPFRETNYEPEIFYQWAPNWDVFGIRFNGAQIGFNHMSNGQDLLKSRSWNRIIATAAFSSEDSAYYLRTWYRIPENDKSDPLDPTGDDNPDILDFYGRAEFGMVYDFGPVNVMAKLRNNLSFSDNRSGLELNVFYPISERFDIMFQYFNGYGDSLIDYNRHLQRFSLGISLRSI